MERKVIIGVVHARTGYTRYHMVNATVGADGKTRVSENEINRLMNSVPKKISGDVLRHTYNR